MENKNQGFTLIEVLIAFSIFVIITGLVLVAVFSGFRSFGQGQRMAQKEQRKRFVFFRLGKELSSLTRVVYPGSYFKGDDNSFFLSTTRRMA